MNFYKGNRLYNKGQYDKAIAEYLDCIENCIKMEECYYNIGVSYFKLKEYDTAIKWYKKAISLNRENRYFYNLGACYCKKEDYGSALFNLIIALKIDPYDEDTKNAINKVTEEIKKNHKN